MSDSSVLGLAVQPLPRDKRLRLGVQLGRLLRVGNLTLELPGGETYRFHGTEPGPVASLVIHDARTISKIMFGGSLGFAEAYLKGWWDSPNLTEMLLLGIANEASWDALINGKRWMRMLSGVMHRLRPNSRARGAAQYRGSL